MTVEAELESAYQRQTKKGSGQALFQNTSTDSNTSSLLASSGKYKESETNG